MELKDAFKQRLDAVGAGLSEEEVQAVSIRARAGHATDKAALARHLQHSQLSRLLFCSAVGMQILDEQLRAFEFNIAIMREFPIGLLPQLRAPLHLLPARYLAAAAAALLALVVALAAARAR